MFRANALLIALLLGTGANAFARETARHVVVVVWDGMRPDFVSKQNTPTLFELAQGGVFFQNHHAVFLSSTEVNATALATGCFPDHAGIIGNEEYWPAIDPLRPLRSDAAETVREGDELTGQRFLTRPTLPEIIRRAGGTVVVAGAKPVTLLVDRAPRDTASQGVALFGGLTLPTSFIGIISSRCGRFPVSNETNSLRNDWTTEALTGVLWADHVPEFSLLWMNQPDFAQHTTGPGSAAVLASLRDLDRNLAQVLRALEAKGARDSTDVFVVSDHGFSTISEKVDLAKDLRQAGFKVTRQFQTDPDPGEILVVSNGSTSFLYVIGHDENVVGQLVRFLQGWRYAGVICTKKPMTGTFTLAQVHAASANAPDLIVCLRWSAGQSTNGTPGLVACDTGYGPGQGTHGSLSPFEMHNLLIAAGPDFRAGMVDQLPTGNIDIAPTVAWLLGVKSPSSMDGRVLAEALRRPGSHEKRPKSYHFEARRELGGMVWHQYLKYNKLGGVVYYDDGNGYQENR